MVASAPTAVWLGHLAPGTEPEQERFLAELRQPATARRLRENYHLTTYRVESRAAALRVTFSARQPAALANFLKAHQLWPSFWVYDGRGSPEPPGTDGWQVVYELGVDGPSAGEGSRASQRGV